MALCLPMIDPAEKFFGGCEGATEITRPILRVRVTRSSSGVMEAPSSFVSRLATSIEPLSMRDPFEIEPVEIGSANMTFDLVILSAWAAVNCTFQLSC